MATVGNLFVNVSARTEQFVSGLAKARASLNAFGSSLISAKVLGFGAAITAAATAIGGYYLKTQADAIDRNYKLATSLGIATEAMGGLAYAGDLSGVGADKLGTAMQRLARMVGDAANGVPTATTALAQFGLQASDLNGLSLDQVFIEISERISAMTSPAERASAAIALFGRSGGELIPFLRTGGDAMRALTQEALDLGAVVGGAASAQVEAANDSLTRMKTILQGVANAILVEASPYIVQLGDDLVAAAKAAGGFGPMVREAFGSAIPVLVVAYDVIRAIGVVVEGLTAAWQFGGSVWAHVGANMLWVLDKLTLGLTGLGEAAADVRLIANELGDQAEKSFAGMVESIDAMASSPIEEFVARAEKTRDRLNELGTAADGAAAAIEGVADATAQEMAKAQADAIDSADKLAHRLFDQARTFGMTGREAEIYLASVNGATEAQLAYLGRVDEWLTKKEAEADALKRVNDEAERAAQTHTDLVASLDDQIATFGMSAAMVDLYRASMRGANDEQTEQIRSLHEILDAKRREAELFEEGQRVMRDVMTPQEKYNEQLDRLRQLLDAGAINSETFARASMAASEDLARSLDRGVAMQTPQSIGVETALGTIKLPGVTDAVGVQEQLLTEAERQTGFLEAIAGDSTGGTRSLDGAVPSGLVRVEEAMVLELRRANETLVKIEKNTSTLGKALT